MNKKLQYIIFAIIVLVIGGGAFYGGMLYKGSQSPRGMGNFAARNSSGGARFAMGNNFVLGDVISKDDQSITVKSRDGSSKIILYSTSTEVSKFAEGSLADVIVGSSIMVNGKTNSDGSISATSIQIRPVMPQGTPSG